MLGVSITVLTALALGGLVARGLSGNTFGYNSLSLYGPIALGVAVMTWRRFRRVAIRVDDARLEAVSIWGVRKWVRLQALSGVSEAGKPLAPELHFRCGQATALKLLRRVWTPMQLETLSTFIEMPIPRRNLSIRSRIDSLIGSSFMTGWDLLFVVMAISLLLNAVVADQQAHSYQQATTTCVTMTAENAGTCYSFLPARVISIGTLSFGQFSLELDSAGQRYAITGVSNQTSYNKFHEGANTYAKVWKGNITLVEAEGDTWVETTMNPLREELETRNGPQVWILAIVGVIPVLIRLHPIVM